MRKFITSILLFSLIISCEKATQDERVAFKHTTLKPWFDKNCSRCHATGKSNYLSWEYKIDDFETTFTPHNKKMLYRVIVTERVMPKNASLTDIEIEIFKNWFDQGCPNN
jgi:hypothetical protein